MHLQLWFHAAMHTPQPCWTWIRLSASPTAYQFEPLKGIMGYFPDNVDIFSGSFAQTQSRLTKVKIDFRVEDILILQTPTKLELITKVIILIVALAFVSYSKSLQFLILVTCLAADGASNASWIH